MLVTLLVVIAKVAMVCPAGISKDVPFPGIAAVLLPASFTVTPPPGAGPLKVTVPWQVSPPATVVGVKVNDAIVSGGFTVIVALRVTPP